VPNEVHLDLTLKTLPPVLARGQHVLILIWDPQQRKYILSRKNYYPTGMTRLLGGGRERDEEPLVAAQREFTEETGKNVNLKEIRELGLVTADIQVVGQPETIHFVTDVYAVEITRQEITPQDDVDEVVLLDDEAYDQLLETYEHLPQEIDPGRGFAWYDYGQYYGPVHRLARQWFQENQKK
jgi:8-oxo-dGTP pyrophosphatase MutT (NUDIX family)